MPTRRAFLRTTLVVSTLPAGTWFFAEASRFVTVPVRIITAADCPDTAAYSRALPSLSERIDIYADQNFHDLASAIDDDAVGALAGLTRHAELILISQLALESGFHLVYSGKHHYQDDGLAHHLKGDREVIDRLSNSFNQGKHTWSGNLAEHVPEMLRSSGLTAQAGVRSNARRPVSSPGYLVSWAFRRI